MKNKGAGSFMLYLLLMGLVYNMNLKGTLKEC